MRFVPIEEDGKEGGEGLQFVPLEEPYEGPLIEDPIERRARAGVVDQRTAISAEESPMPERAAMAVRRAGVAPAAAAGRLVEGFGRQAEAGRQFLKSIPNTLEMKSAVDRLSRKADEIRQIESGGSVVAFSPEAAKKRTDDLRAQILQDEQTVNDLLAVYHQYKRERDKAGEGATSFDEVLSGKGDFWTWAGESLGQGVVSMAPILAAAAVPVVGGPLALGAGVALNTADIQQQRQDQRIDERYFGSTGVARPSAIEQGMLEGQQVIEQIDRERDVTGAVVAGYTLLDVALGPAGKAIKGGFVRLFGKEGAEAAEKEVAEQLAKLTKAQAVKAVLKEMGFQTFEEALNEGGQEFLSVLMEKALDDKDVFTYDTAKRLMNAAAAGGLTGGVVGGAAKGGQIGVAKAKAGKAAEPAPADFKALEDAPDGGKVTPSGRVISKEEWDNASPRVRAAWMQTAGEPGVEAVAGVEVTEGQVEEIAAAPAPVEEPERVTALREELAKVKSADARKIIEEEIASELKVASDTQKADDLVAAAADVSDPAVKKRLLDQAEKIRPKPAKGGVKVEELGTIDEAFAGKEEKPSTKGMKVEEGESVEAQPVDEQAAIDEAARRDAEERELPAPKKAEAKKVAKKKAEPEVKTDAALAEMRKDAEDFGIDLTGMDDQQVAARMRDVYASRDAKDVQDLDAAVIARMAADIDPDAVERAAIASEGDLEDFLRRAQEIIDGQETRAETRPSESLAVGGKRTEPAPGGRREGGASARAQPAAQQAEAGWRAPVRDQQSARPAERGADIGRRPAAEQPGAERRGAPGRVTAADREEARKRVMGMAISGAKDVADFQRKVDERVEQVARQIADERAGRVDDTLSLGGAAYTGQDEVRQVSRNRPIDGATLRTLRREAAGIERPDIGAYLRVTDDGRAIATGPAGEQIPAAFRDFARKHKLPLTINRNGLQQQDIPTGYRLGDSDAGRGRMGSKAGQPVTGAPMASQPAVQSQAPMPIEYREGGALYAAEMGDQTYSPSDRETQFSVGAPNAIGLYSALERALDQQIKAKSMPKGDWLNTLKSLPAKGVKPDEIEWSGIREWLELQGPRVEKQAVLDYLNANGVKVEEVTLRQQGVREDMDPRVQRAIAELEEMGWEVSGNMENEAQAIFVAPDGTDYDALELQESDEVDERVKELARRIEAPDNMPAKFSTYVVPGGTNYREVLLTLPAAELKKGDRLGGGTVNWKNVDGSYNVTMPDGAVRVIGNETREGLFRSPHWDQPNVLAHVRVDDRVDADGKRVLFVNEIQSDWAQKGRKEGFGQRAAEKRVRDGERRELLEAMRAKLIEKLTADGKITEDEAGTIADGAGQGYLAHMVGMADQYNDLVAREQADRADAARVAVPRAPFVDTTDKWVTLALKRILRMAAEGGYDKVAFINGQQAADLYDLSKHLDRLEYWPKSGLVAGYKDGNQIVNKPGVKPEELADVVGKEAAEKLLATDTDKGTRPHELRGGNLRIGGEGMRAFYDKIVPAAANKLLAKVGGGKVETAKFKPFSGSPYEYVNERGEVGAAPGAMRRERVDQQPAITITPEMRERVMSGLPMFKVGEQSTGETKAAPKRVPPPVANTLQEVADALAERFKEPVVWTAVDPFDKALGEKQVLQNRLAAKFVEQIFDKMTYWYEQASGPVINGFSSTRMPRAIFMSVNGKHPTLAVTGHEFLHMLRKTAPEVYNAFLVQMIPLVQAKYPQWKAEIQDRYKRTGSDEVIKDDLAYEELAADIFGDRWTEPEFWKEMERQTGGRWKKMAETFLQFLDDLIGKVMTVRPFGTEKYISDLKKAREIVAKAMLDYKRVVNRDREAMGIEAGLDQRIASLAIGTPESRRRSSVSLRDKTESIAFRAKTTRAIGEGLNERTAKNAGRISEYDTSSAARDKLAEAIADEVEYEIRKDEHKAGASGLGWYSNNYPRAVSRLASVFPELAEDGPYRNMFTALVAIFSNGQKVDVNARMAVDAYKAITRDGVALEDSNQASNRETGNALREYASLVREKGVEGARDYLLEELTVAEMNAALRASGKEASGDYAADMRVPRAALILGPKIGVFYANLSGSHGYLTMDRWWSRSFNRLRGTLIPWPTEKGLDRLRELLEVEQGESYQDISDDDVIIAAVPYWYDYSKKNYKNGTEIEKAANTVIKQAALELEDAPKRATERKFMVDTAQRAQQVLADRGIDITVADVQAALWYYEKRLYWELGARDSGTIGYEEAINGIAERLAGESVRPAASIARIANARTGSARPDQVAGARQVDSAESAGEETSLSLGGAPRVTDTPEFKRWFGDSKVVDENGAPLVVYHGTGIKKSQFRRDRGDGMAGAYFTPSKVEAKQHAEMDASVDGTRPIVYGVYLSIQNPKVLTGMDSHVITHEQRDALEKEGFDGAVNYENGEWVAFRPEQIKSAIGNRGTFDPASPDITLSIGGPPSQALRRSPSNPQGGFWNTPDPLWRRMLDYLNRGFADNLERLARVQKALGPAIRDEINTYAKETGMHGRQTERLVDIKRRFMDPIHRIAAVAKLSQQDVSDYLYALHAPEANAHIAQINPNLPTGGSGLTDAEARSIIAGFKPEQRKALDKIAALVRSMNDEKLERMVAEGLITRDYKNELQAKFPNWVSLKNFEDDSILGASKVAGMSGGMEIKGKEFKARTGRVSRAEDPLTMTVRDAMLAVIRAEKNRVARSFVQMVRENPNPDLWEMVTDANYPTRREVGADGTVREVKDAGALFREPQFFGAKVDGEQVFVRIKDELLAEQMHKLGESGFGKGVIGDIGRAINTATRTMSMLYTQLSPDFMLVNPIRDVQQSIVVATSFDKQKGNRLALRLAKSLPAALATSMRYQWAKLIDGTATGPDAALFEQFRMDGGTTGGFGLMDAEQIQRELQRQIDAASGKPTAMAIKAATTLFEPVMALNDAFENMSRFAVYKAALEEGFTRQQATVMAKNVTVNFNKRGTASPVFNALYAFFNASIQGNLVVARAIAKSRTAQAAALGLFMLGVMQEIAGDEEDETGTDPKDYVSEFKRDRAFVMPIGEGSAITVPLAYGLNIPFAMGRHAVRAITGKESPGHAVAKLLELTFTTYLPTQTWTPTPLQPLVAANQNKDFAGRDIAWENKYDSATPKSEQYRENANKVAVEVAKALNAMTGGSEFEKGAIDIAPEKISYVVKQYMGGIAAPIEIMSVPFKETVKARDIPVYRRFVNERSDTFYVGQARGIENENRLQRRIIENTDAEVSDAKLDYLEESREAERDLARLYRDRNQAKKAGNKEEVKAIDAEIDRAAREIVTLRNRAKSAEVID